VQNSFDIVAVFGKKVERCFDIVAGVDRALRTVVERRSVTGELSLFYARPAADG